MPAGGRGPGGPGPRGPEPYHHHTPRFGGFWGRPIFGGAPGGGCAGGCLNSIFGMVVIIILLVVVLAFGLSSCTSCVRGPFF